MDKISFKIKSMDVETGEFEGLASVYGNVDAYGEIVERGAFTKTIQEKGGVVPLLWQHNPSKVIGIGELTDSHEGLRIKGKLNLAVEKAREALALLKQKAVNGLSIGFDVVKDSFEGSVRMLKEIALWEVSVVTFPANEEALVTDVKNVVPFHNLPIADRDTEWNEEEALSRINIDKGKKSKGYLWRNDDNKGLYKFQIADIINGRLTAIPRAIFAAAAAVNGSSKDAGISSSELVQVKTHLGRYFKKMDLTAPWDRTKGLENDLVSIIGYSEHLSGNENLKNLNKELLDQAIQSLTSLRECRAKSVEPGNHSNDDANKSGADIDGKAVSALLGEMKDYIKKGE